MLHNQLQKGLGGLKGQCCRERSREAHQVQDPTHLILHKQVTCPSLSFLN